MRIKSRNDVYHIFISIGIIFYILWKMPIVSLYCNTYIAMVILILTIFLLIGSSYIRLNQFPQFLIVLLFFTLFELLDYYGTAKSIFLVGWSIFLDLFPLIIGYLLVRTKQDKLIDKIVSLVVITSIITAVTTIMGLQIFPNASRELATGGELYVSRYYAYNIGGFSFIYSLVLIHPMLICRYKSKCKSYIAIFITIIFALCIFKSNYTTATLFFLISCFAYIIPDSNNKSKKRLFGVIVIILSIVIYYRLPSILDYLSELPIFEASSGKMSDLSNMLLGGEAIEYDTNARMLLFKQSWEAFLSNPLLGSRFTGKSGGGHSYILDFAASYGIIGIIMLCAIYKALFNNLKRISDNSSIMIYTSFSMVIAIAMSFVNPDLWLYNIGFVTPLVAYSVVQRTK